MSGFHQEQPQFEHPESKHPVPQEEPHDVSQGSHVVQQDVVEQHPLVNPQAASSISFALNEDRRRFIVALPVRTQGAGRVENSFIEDGEKTYRATKGYSVNLALLVCCLSPACRFNLLLRIPGPWQSEDRLLRFRRNMSVLARWTHHPTLWRIALWDRRNRRQAALRCLILWGRLVLLVAWVWSWLRQ